MPHITATELELLAFFGVEPVKLAPEDPWIYNSSCYQVDAGGLSLSFAVEPAYKDVRIILKQGLSRLYELNAKSVVDVRYHKENIRESLEITLSASETLWLWLKPSIEFLHERG